MKRTEGTFTQTGIRQSGKRTRIERSFPWRDLRVVSRRQGTRKPPIYSVHRWWARRPPELYRTILTHLVDGTEDDAAVLAGRTVLDPFMGGGTTLVEAQALGAKVIGFDTEALACRITDVELRTPPSAKVWKEIEAKVQHVERGLRQYYGANSMWETLHLFWVDVVDCQLCRQRFDAHPQVLLACERDAKEVVALCRYCSRLHHITGSRVTIHCVCGRRSRLTEYNAKHGSYCCPFCRHVEKIKSYVARRGGRSPERRLIAKEEINWKTGSRRFRPISQKDLQCFEDANGQFHRREEGLPIPRARVRTRPGDGRPRSYGYSRYRDMFNTRQLLHHGSVLKAFLTLTEPARSIALLAFSDSLATNCMFCPYSARWRRLAGLFSIHGYMYVSRPVELNPWLDGVGRGTLRNCIRRVRLALESKQGKGEPAAAQVYAGSLDAFRDENWRVDFIVTDPPYFDNLDYSYLAKFYSVWLRGVAARQNIKRVGGTPLSVQRPPGRHAEAEEFHTRLGRIFAASRARLRRNGLLVFTFANRRQEAWEALRRALAAGGFQMTAVYGVETEGRNGFHGGAGNLRWNALFVCRPYSGRRRSVRIDDLREALKVKGMSRADRDNLQMALRMARRTARSKHQ